MKKYLTTYRAYIELLEKLRGEPFLKSLLRSYGTKEARKNDEFKGRISQREIETDWLDAIENGLRYIDQAIRENRRFIVTQEEVVPIERARKITSESVRHLAQHTSLISKFENGIVTPEKILNVEKEETFVVYENRFLRTLILELTRFVDKVIEKVGKADDYVKYSVKLGRKFKSAHDRINLKFEYEYEQLQPTSAEALLDEDTSEKSELERVFRIKKILVDFMGTQLMKALTGTEPVRPPIIQTNVMKQNVAFKKSYELYTFIMSYRKPGYKVVVNEDDKIFSKNTNKELTAMFYLTDFALAVNANEILETKLRRAYERELEREAKIAEMQRQREIDEWNDKIADAVRRTTDEYEAILEETTSELTRYKNLYEEYYANYSSVSSSYADLQKKYALQETKFYDELEMVKNDYEAQIAEIQALHEKIVAAKDAELAERTESLTLELTQEKLYTAQKIEELHADKEEALAHQAEEHKLEVARMQELRSQELQKEKEYWENRLAEASAESQRSLDEFIVREREQMMRIFNTLLYVRGSSEMITEEKFTGRENVERAFADRRAEIEAKAAEEAETRTRQSERDRYEQRLRTFDDEYARVINEYRDRLKALGDVSEIKGLESYTVAAGSPFAVKRLKNQPDRRYEKQDKAIARSMRRYIMETRPYARNVNPDGILLLADDDGAISGKDYRLYETRFVPGVVTEENSDKFFSVLSEAVKTDKLVIYVGSSSKVRPNCDIVYKFAKELRFKNLIVIDTEGLLCGVSVLLKKLTAMLGAGVELADAVALIDEMKKGIVSVYLASSNVGDANGRLREIKYNGYINSCDALIEMKGGVPEITGMIRGSFTSRVKSFFGGLSSRLASKATSSVCLWTSGLDVEEISLLKQTLSFDYGFRTVRVIEDSDSQTARLLGKGAFGITYLSCEREIDKFIRHAAKRPDRVEIGDSVSVYADAALLPEGYDGGIIAAQPAESGFFGRMNALRKTIKDNVKNGGVSLVLVPESQAEECERAAAYVSRAFECSLEILPVRDCVGSSYAALRFVDKAIKAGGNMALGVRNAVDVSTLVLVCGKPTVRMREELKKQFGFEYTEGVTVTGVVDGRKKFRRFKNYAPDVFANAVGSLLDGVENRALVLVGSRFDSSAAESVMTELREIGGSEVIAVDLKATPDLGKNIAAVHIAHPSVTQNND